MDGLFWKSSTWRWLVTRSKTSSAFFVGFSAACVSGCVAMAMGLQALTNPGTVDLGGGEGSADTAGSGSKDEREASLLRQGRPDAAMIGRLNKERLGQMLEEIRNKENTEDRYAAALRGETLLGTPMARHYATGSSIASSTHSQQQQQQHIPK